jgi:hypothetical protein
MALRASRFWTKVVEATVLVVAICFSLGAATPATRMNTLSHQLMCQCGCAQLLGECDHVGCPDLVAWVAPFAVFAAALLGTILLIRRWGGLGGKPLETATAGAESSDPADRERLQRIRRETGSDGGF